MIGRTLLLDTNALVFLRLGLPIRPEAERLIAESLDGDGLRISSISAWEIGLLVARGRLALPMPPLAWFKAAASHERIRLDPLDPDVLIASSFLPGEPPNDPADRIIAATAREFGRRLVTRDARLLAYAEAGHLDAVAC